MLDAKLIADQFPSLKQAVNGRRLVYLDNAATTQKPQCVIDTITRYYTSQNANVHRGSHSLTASATQAFESARETVRDYIGADSTKTIIWTRGATEAINLVAQTYARSALKQGDEILVGEMEHHANIVPWQIVAQQTGAKVIKIPMQTDCSLDMAAYQKLLNPKTKIVALAHITNVTGTRQPIEQAIGLAHLVGAKVLIDGAQGIVHERIDVSILNADFYVFSGHKIFAPAGIGVLYGKQTLLEAMPPYHGGGKMVDKVSFDGTTFDKLPGKFEAGTPNVAGALALATAIKWYESLSIELISTHLHDLVTQTCRGLTQIEGVRIIGIQESASLLSFVVDGIHHQDIATLLDQQGIAVRAGNHCAHPLMEALGVKGTIRVSFAAYNTKEDVDQFLEAVSKAIDLL
ncbi:aminotransferase class V-fold PLP-dependent enzyme [Vibrio caribbeanicus]|uniref:Probable cysteine desulfurase n=1 Tax=Vibrio caribbeanicus ATCC BAA-2122 TaxID=796620 RepID=E3BN56_9VIBR|nr:cysteine desulfurase [Vibrio caribbeanicus]EFP95498.1 selenocysteine lyase [Vibrio caribbeanicus ATCC BAA-2122]